MIKIKEFSVDARLGANPQVNFLIDAEFIETLNFSVKLDGIVIRANTFTINAIFSTEPEDPDFSESHMLDITHMFSGIADIGFIIDANVATPSFFRVDAIIQPTTFTTVDAVLTTVPQPLFWSVTHIQDIVPLFSIAQPEELSQVDGLIQEKDKDRIFFVDTKLVLQPDETFEIDSILSIFTKTVGFDLDALLRATIDETALIDSRVISRNVIDFTIEALVFGFTQESYDLDGLLKAEFNFCKYPLPGLGVQLPLIWASGRHCAP